MKQFAAIILALGWLLSASQFGASAAEQPYIDVRVETDRSAIWVGDRLIERVTVTHDSQIRFVADNIQKASLNLDPFEIVNLEHRESPAAKGRGKLEIDLLLTTYDTEARDLEIPSFNLFYFVESGSAGPGSDRAAETLVVPAVPVVLRSTVPAGANAVREQMTAPGVKLRYRLAMPIAAGLLLLAVVLLAPAVLQGKKYHASQDLARKRKQARQDLRHAANSLISRPADSESRLAEFYEETNLRMREFLAAFSSAPTEGKTAKEITAIFQQDGLGADAQAQSVVRDVVAILGICDQVRFAPDSNPIGSNNRAGVMDRLKALASI